VGLVNTSILLQYYELAQEDAADDDFLNLQEWMDLTAMDPLNISLSSEVSVNFDVDSSVQGLQFRLLQLEHGDGSRGS
jgi:hypothetical protein